MRLATVLLVSTTLAGCEVNLNTEGLSAREVKTFKVTGQAELSLDTFDGAIELHSWDKDEIEVEIEKRAMEQTLLDEIKVDSKQQDNKVIVKVTGPARERHGVTIGMHISPTARLRVAVPRSINLTAVSSDGSIRAEAIEGRIVLNTTDGRIRVEGKPGILRARTGDGSIRANIEPDTVMADNWELTTSDGSVTVTLPGIFNVELDAETSDGSVVANHPLIDDGSRLERREGEDREERRERRRTLRSKLGDGGKMFRIRTGDGSIRIER